MHPSRCLSSARTARAAHWPSVPSSRRARRLPCRACARGGSAVEWYTLRGRATAVPFGPCALHTLQQPDADRLTRRAAGSGDTHSTRQLRVERALTAAPPPQQLSLLLEYSREGLRPKSGVPERAVPSRVLRAQMRVGARTHTTADRPHAPMPARWLPRGIFARAARTALADSTSCGGKRANGSRAHQASRQQQCAGGRRRGVSRNCTIGGDARVVRGVGRAGALRFESEPAANERIAPSRAANG